MLLKWRKPKRGAKIQKVPCLNHLVFYSWYLFFFQFFKVVILFKKRENGNQKPVGIYPSVYGRTDTPTTIDACTRLKMFEPLHLFVSSFLSLFLFIYPCFYPCSCPFLMLVLKRLPVDVRCHMQDIEKL